VSEKRKIRTLFARNGKVWIDDEHFPSAITSFARAHVPVDKDDFGEVLKYFLRNRFTQIRGSKVSSYVTSEEFRKLEKRMKTLEDRLDQITESPKIMDTYAVVNYFVSQTEDLKEVRKVYYRHEEKNLDFFLVADHFSSDLLENISEIEIILSRKFPDLSIDIEPLFCDEEVPDGSYIVLVK
jgi:hypothetical protein